MIELPANPAPDACRSFLVTSVGAYADSGIRTGGFACVHEGKAVIIDKIDSTGLYLEGETVYRFVADFLGVHGESVSRRARRQAGVRQISRDGMGRRDGR